MSELYHTDENFRPPYWDRKYYTTYEDQIEALHGSSTIYVGNLSFYTSELQIHEMMSIVGPVKRIIMGLNKNTKTPCGFCFVEYFTHEHAVECLKFINQSKCDDRVIKCELDGGFHEGRQYGRGAAGGQIRDEKRTTPDVGRGAIVMPGGVTRNSFAVQAPSLLGKRDSGGDHRNGRRHSSRDYDRDRYGRDRRPPPPPPIDKNSSLPTQRRPSSSSVNDEKHSTNDLGDDERPRKNPRFREDKEEDEDEN